MYLFDRWYQQPSFVLLYLVLMVIYLLLGRVVSWKQLLLVLPLVLIVLGPEYVQQIARSVHTFLNAYVSPPPAGMISLPDILGIVSETQSRGVEVMLRRLHGFLPLVFAGFAGLSYLCIRHFRQMIPVSPLIVLGIWSLFGPNRFAMYLAPLIGIGVGVLVELLVKYAGRKVRFSSLSVALTSLAVMFILFFSTSAYTGFFTHPAPIIDAKTTKALLDIKRIVPQHSAMFTSEWSHGYPLMEIGNFATYHDGSLQGGLRTTLIDKSIMSARQQDMVSLISYLEDFGFNHLAYVIDKEKLSADKLQDMVYRYPGEFKGENVYVLYLENSIWKFDAIAYFGAWDFNRKKSTPLVYVELECSPQFSTVMNCKDGTIDLGRGVMNDGSIDIPLKGALFVNDGYVVSERYYDHKSDYYLQVLMRGGQIYTIVVADEQIFQSNFNQQYLLGNYDRRYFEEVYNNFPIARVLKVKRAGHTDSRQ
jgi:dolichyl-diphosphooligosaccharide--protein glycosyltransferase